MKELHPPVCEVTIPRMEVTVTMNDTDFKLIKLTAPQAEILIVDDNEINLNILAEILMQYKMQVTTALSGRECLSIIEGYKKVYDLIFMDQMMPVMDGVQTLKKLRKLPNKHYQTAPVIALTANDEPGIEEKYLMQGFQGYMAKPVDISLLNRLLISNISCDKIIVEDISSFNQNSDNMRVLARNSCL
jgi:CheY-like chemotaxis protein